MRLYRWRIERDQVMMDLICKAKGQIYPEDNRKFEGL